VGQPILAAAAFEAARAPSRIVQLFRRPCTSVIFGTVGDEAYSRVVPQLGAVEYGFIIAAGVAALALALVARARRRERRDRDELRAHIRRLNGPSDPGM